MNENNLVILRVNGREWGGWTALSISAGVERIARDFNVTITRQWPGADDKAELQPRVKYGDAVEVSIENDLVLTGYVDATPVRYDASGISVGIVGRSKTADLIDCSAAPTQFTGRTLVQIATQLAAPFGVGVIDAGVESGAMLGLQADHGETVMDVLNKMIGLKQVLAYDNEKGQLVVGPTGAEHTVTALVLGQNILSCDTERSIRDRFSQYDVAGQRAGNNDDFGAATTSAIRAQTVDAGVKRYRPLIIKQTGNATGQTCKDRSEFEMYRRAARTDEVTYTVQGWRQGDGSLWKSNQTVVVYDPVLGFNNREMLIAEVTYKQDDTGTTTEIRVGPSEAYLPKAKAIKSSRRKKTDDEDF